MRRSIFLDSLLILLIIIIQTGYAQKVYNSRDEIPDQCKWDLSDIYEDWDAWELGLKQLETKMDEIVKFKGKIKESSENLLKVQKLDDELGILAYKVYRFPKLTSDTDTRDQEVKSKLQRVQILFAQYNTAVSWIEPEILEVPWETMKKWLDSDPEFQAYRFGIENLYRQHAHVLDEEREKLLSYFTRFNGAPSDIYSNISAADIDFPEITLSTGDTIRVTNGNYSKVLSTNRNQEDRKKTFEAHYGTFEAQKNTYAAIYSAVCQKNWALAQARNYNSCLEADLDDNNIPVAVYESLVNSVKENVAPLQKYHKLRKKILGLEHYHSYDGSIPLVDFDKAYPYQQAKEWVLASVEPLGEEYQSKVQRALQGGWIDVFENTGKTPGAYSANVYGVHPYMLLNYNETLRYVFTLGHEIGHAMHTLLANESQPFATASYTIFVAEVASTFNEALLLDHLLEQTEDPKERITLLQQAINGITGTFYFQSLLADFEWRVHRLVEQGQPITAKILTDTMKELYITYFADSEEEDELLYHVWARIPHIYQAPFYVYQYATCKAASAQIYKNVMQAPSDKRQKETERYLTLLKSGGNDYPMEQLKKAGVDLTQKETFLAIMEQLDQLVDQLDQEVKKLN